MKKAPERRAQRKKHKAQCMRQEYGMNRELNKYIITELEGDVKSTKTFEWVSTRTGDGFPEFYMGSEVVGMYEYWDVGSSEPPYYVLKTEKNERIVGRFVNEKWVEGRGDSNWILYSAPELAEANPSKPVFFEEDEEAAEKMKAKGFPATCCPPGAGKRLNQYSEPLQGRYVIILRNNTEAERQEARSIKLQLDGVAHSYDILSMASAQADCR